MDPLDRVDLKVNLDPVDPLDLWALLVLEHLDLLVPWVYPDLGDL